MSHVFDPKAPKKRTNVSVNSDLLEKAKRLNINLSTVLEGALAGQVRTERRKLWKEENIGAIQAYNDFIATNCVFSDGLRKF